MEPMGPPPVGGPFTTVTCGQDVSFPDLTGTEFILMECTAFNGTPPLTMAVYKDGELIPGAGFPYVIVGADRDAFGTYTFVLSAEFCGTDTAVINVLRQGRFLGLTLAGSKCYSYIVSYQSTRTSQQSFKTLVGLILL